MANVAYATSGFNSAYVAMVAMVASATSGFTSASATSGDTSSGLCHTQFHLTNIYAISQAIPHLYSSVKLSKRNVKLRFIGFFGTAHSKKRAKLC